MVSLPTAHEQPIRWRGSGVFTAHDQCGHSSLLSCFSHHRIAQRHMSMTLFPLDVGQPMRVSITVTGDGLSSSSMASSVIHSCG